MLVMIGLFACEKPLPPTSDPAFEITVNNEFNELNGRFALFFSDPENGETISFSWLPGETITTVEAPDSKTTDRFDCTLVKVSTLIAPGTGVRDTFVHLTTYTGLSSGATINLRDQVFQQATDLKFQLVGMNTLDSIVVPDAYAIQRPQASNNYHGEYRCFHTGSIWLRVLVNDEKFCFSVARVLAQRLFPSVQFHLENWVRRAWSCHTNMDNRSMDRWATYRDWPEICRKFRHLEPLLTDQERGKKFFRILAEMVGDCNAGEVV